MRFRLLRLYGAEGDDEGTGSGDQPPSGDSSADDGSDSQPAQRTLTQEELDKITARAADRASRSATKALAADLGFEKVADLKAWALTQKEAQEEQRSEAEKAAAKLAADQASVDTSRTALAQERLEVQIEKAVVRAGVTDEKKLDRLLTLVYAEIDETEDEDGWSAQIGEALEGLRGDMPELFASSARGSGDGGARGDSLPPDQNKEAEEEKKWDQEYKNRGYVSADFSDL